LYKEYLLPTTYYILPTIYHFTQPSPLESEINKKRKVELKFIKPSLILSHPILSYIHAKKSYQTRHDKYISTLSTPATTITITPKFTFLQKVGGNQLSFIEYANP